MTLTLYRRARRYSFEDHRDADEITLGIPDGTSLLPCGTLGLVAFVPTAPHVRSMWTARDLYMAAMMGELGATFRGCLEAEYRQCNARSDEIRESATRRRTA